MYFSSTMGLGYLQEVQDKGGITHDGYAITGGINRKIRPRIETGMEFTFQKINYLSTSILNQHQTTYSTHLFSRIYWYENRRPFFNDEPVNPYIRLGIGYFTSRLKYQNDQDNSHGFTAQFGMGINFRLTTRKALHLEYVQMRSFRDDKDIAFSQYTPALPIENRLENWAIRLTLQLKFASRGIVNPKFR